MYYQVPLPASAQAAPPDPVPPPGLSRAELRGWCRLHRLAEMPVGYIFALSSPGPTLPAAAAARDDDSPTDDELPLGNPLFQAEAVANVVVDMANLAEAQAQPQADEMLLREPLSIPGNAKAEELDVEMAMDVAEAEAQAQAQAQAQVPGANIQAQAQDSSSSSAASQAFSFGPGDNAQAQAQAAGQASSSGQLPGANNQAQAEAQALHYTSFPQAQVQAQAQPDDFEICDEYERGFAWFTASSSWGQPREEDEYSDEER